MMDRQETRAEMAERLEAELDEFISAMADKSTGYKDGWPEDRWEEEMDKHPFFAKGQPALSDGELPPLFEGLASLKFDPEHNTAQELRDNYKKDGDFYFGAKKYRLAIISYTEAIKAVQDDPVLYGNRSAAHFKLCNHRSSLDDCRKALSLDSDYIKCKYRAAHCAFALSEFKACVEYCKDALSSGDVVGLAELKEKAENILQEKAKRESNEKDVMVLALKKGIRVIDPSSDENDVEIYRSSIPSIETPAHLSEDGSEILWPVVLLYPEYDVYDYFQDYPESSTVGDLITEVLSSHANWDIEKKYFPSTVDVFYVGETADDLHKIDQSKSLLDVMTEPTFRLRTLTPVFVVKLKKR